MPHFPSSMSCCMTVLHQKMVTAKGEDVSSKAVLNHLLVLREEVTDAHLTLIFQLLIGYVSFGIHVSETYCNDISLKILNVFKLKCVDFVLTVANKGPPFRLIIVGLFSSVVHVAHVTAFLFYLLGSKIIWLYSRRLMVRAVSPCFNWIVDGDTERRMRPTPDLHQKRTEEFEGTFCPMAAQENPRRIQTSHLKWAPVLFFDSFCCFFVLFLVFSFLLSSFSRLKSNIETLKVPMMVDTVLWHDIGRQLYWNRSECSIWTGRWRAFDHRVPFFYIHSYIHISIFILQGLGCMLSTADHNAIDNFLRDFVSRTLLPKLEERIAHLNLSITATRRGLRNRINRLWKTSGQEGAIDDTAYPYHSIEAQVVQLGTFALMTISDERCIKYNNKQSSKSVLWKTLVRVRWWAALLSRYPRSTLPNHFFSFP